jgi:hypothetical protein
MMIARVDWRRYWSMGRDLSARCSVEPDVKQRFLDRGDDLDENVDREVAKSKLTSEQCNQHSPGLLTAGSLPAATSSSRLPASASTSKPSSSVI